MKILIVPKTMSKSNRQNNLTFLKVLLVFIEIDPNISHILLKPTKGGQNHPSTLIYLSISNYPLCDHKKFHFF